MSKTTMKDDIMKLRDCTYVDTIKQLKNVEPKIIFITGVLRKGMDDACANTIKTIREGWL